MAASDVSIGFFDALTGLLTEPGGTVRRLFSHERPPHVLGLFTVLLLSLLGPIFWYASRYGVNLNNTPQVSIIILVSLCSVLFFVMLEFVFLRILGVPLTFFDVVGLVTYSMTPVTLIMTLTLAADRIAHGRFVLIGYLLNNGIIPYDSFLLVLPFVLAIAILSVLLVFYYGMQSAALLSSSGTFFLSAISVAPFGASVGLACLVVSYFRPDAIKTVQAFLQVLFSGW